MYPPPYFPSHWRSISHSSTDRNRSSYPASSSAIRDRSSSSNPAARPASCHWQAAAVHRGGNTTHHQFCPAPWPMITRRGQVFPGGQGEAVIVLGGELRRLQPGLDRLGAAPAARVSRASRVSSGKAAVRACSACSMSADCSRISWARASTRSRTRSFRGLILRGVGVGDDVEADDLPAQLLLLPQGSRPPQNGHGQGQQQRQLPVSEM